ncbi:MAG: uroporphyrinogen-III synthase [Methylotetracoccus sp.]|nr:uroporphyrinogen-III synthase [Methylotetracoccus sp.]
MNLHSVKPASLSGWNVLVTRPAAQAERLCMLIEQAGGHPIRFPLITIERSPEASAALERLQREWDWLIFVSPNAVKFACDLGEWWQRLPDLTRIAAIGRGTAAALRDKGLRVDLRPEAQFNSESLLESPEFGAVEGRHVLIVRGCGGRELIAETLRRRGAEVAYAEVYQRRAPAAAAHELLAAWRRGEIHALVLSSVDALENLVNMLGPTNSDLLHRTPMAVIGVRLAARAREVGCRHLDIAAEASDQGLCSAVMRLAHST